MHGRRRSPAVVAPPIGRGIYGEVCPGFMTRLGTTRTSDLFNSAQELGGLQPLSFQGAGYTGIARELPVARRIGWLVLGLRPASAQRGVTQKRYGSRSPKSECPSRT